MTLQQRLQDLASAIRDKINTMMPRLQPPGGTTGQTLAKTSGTDYASGWTTLTKSSVGLGSVDNTSDANKPVSTATQTALNAKLDSASYIKGLSAFCSGKPTSSEIIGGGIAPYSLVVSLTNSTAKAQSPAAATTVFTIKRNISTLGTITFAQAASLGTVALNGGGIVTAGDNITIVGPATADLTLADISFLLRE